MRSNFTKKNFISKSLIKKTLHIKLTKKFKKVFDKEIKEPKNLEMYMLIEHLSGQIESIEKEIEASRYNKVNIDHLKEQVDMLQKKINGTH